MIDNIPTIILHVHGHLAKGFVVNSDLTLKDCYICRFENCFAHGDTAEDAMRDAQNKAMRHLPLDKRLDNVISNYPDVDAVIPNSDLYSIHNMLTGSCEFGRRMFAKEHGIDIENGSMTMRRFIELTKDSYGSDAIMALKNKYNC